ncbi:NUDIX hydrolase [Laceyella putida]|uniref:NUDIX domain-containing protein n=1 Tax=Laceyella putida TaxID=110101 RepID=A0ABW2RFW1_9BACL
MTEWLAIFDEHGQKIGVKSRTEVHKEGDWHETFHCWFVEAAPEGNYLYFQQRSYQKKEFPGKFDITAAGHILADEDRLWGGLRELQEELGLMLTERDLAYLGYVKEEFQDRHLIDKEFCHIYGYQVQAPMLLAIGNEVQCVVKVDMGAFERLLQGKVDKVRALPVAPLPHLVMELGLDDFAPHEPHYFAHVIKELTRFIK